MDKREAIPGPAQDIREAKREKDEVGWPPYKHPEEAAHETVLWEPLHGNPKRGAPSMNYVKLLKKDTGLDNVSEIRTVMEDRDGWRERTRRTSSSTG